MLPLATVMKPCNVHRQATIRAPFAHRSSPRGCKMKAQSVEAIIFDMDGVLTNTMPVSIQAAQQMYKKLYDVDVSEEILTEAAGTAEDNFISAPSEKVGVSDFDIEQARDAYFEALESLVESNSDDIAFKGGSALVQSLLDRKVKIAVASSAPLTKVKTSLKAAGIDIDDFGAVCCEDTFQGPLKPEPDVFVKAADDLGVKPANAVVIEDADVGVQAARAGGFRVVALLTTKDKEVIENEGPDAIFNNISEVDADSLLNLEAKREIATAQDDPAAPDSSPAPVPWLNELVPLPGGYKTTRRDVLKLIPLAGGFGSIAVALANAKRDPAARVWLKRSAWVIQLGIIVYLAQSFAYLSKALSFASPKAVLTALFPRPEPASSAADSAAVRVAAYRRYIAALESRGAEAVPDFPAGAQWLNAPPLQLSRELRGRVVLLDFWTFCCINCMHILPDLAALERKYSGDAVTVVGVHSAKFDHEKDSEAIRNAVLRYDVEHPVVNDADMTLWYALGISSWPTQVVVSPTGKLLIALPGEDRRADIDACVQAALDYYGEAGLLVNGDVPVALERDKQAAVANTPLRFPGKLAVDERGGRVFIADSSNHRILVTDLSGNFLAQVGGNGSGLVDGPATRAAFNRPQGLAYCNNTDRLYVADTESHAVRCVDLASGTVSTLAGNGRKGSDLVGGGQRGAQQLNSPWDVALADGRRLLVAMAGQHQIWELDLETGVCASLSGTGAERNQNGATGATTAWAQPSGLALTPSGGAAYVADAESSSIRLLDTRTGGSTLVAGGDALFADNLFRFGDRDGTSAALQHPLAVACAANGDLYIADSYNHKIKRLRAASKAVSTVAGTGAPGFADGPGSAAQFSEPGGLALLDGGDLLVADTNNGVIRRLALRGGGVEVSTVEMQGVPPVATRAAIGGGAGALPPGTKLVRADAVTGTSGTISVQLDLADGFHLTVGARSAWRAAVSTAREGQVTISTSSGEFDAASDRPAVDVVYSATAGAEGVIRMQLAVYFCRDGDVCLLDNGVVEIPVQLSAAGGSQDVQVTYRVSKQADVM